MTPENQHFRFFDHLMGWQLDKYTDGGAGAPRNKRRAKRAKASRKRNRGAYDGR